MCHRLFRVLRVQLASVPLQKVEHARPEVLGLDDGLVVLAGDVFGPEGVGLGQAELRQVPMHAQHVAAARRTDVQRHLLQLGVLDARIQREVHATPERPSGDAVPGAHGGVGNGAVPVAALLQAEAQAAALRAAPVLGRAVLEQNPLVGEVQLLLVVLEHEVDLLILGERVRLLPPQLRLRNDRRPGPQVAVRGPATTGATTGAAKLASVVITELAAARLGNVRLLQSKRLLRSHLVAMD